jgi:hypothetical protein
MSVSRDAVQKVADEVSCPFPWREVAMKQSECDYIILKSQKYECSHDSSQTKKNILFRLALFRLGSWRFGPSVRCDLSIDCENSGDASNLAGVSLTRKSRNKSSFSVLYPKLNRQIFRACFSGDRVSNAINKVDISLEGVRILRINCGKKIRTPGNSNGEI